MKVDNLKIVSQGALEEVLYHSPVIDKEVSSRKMTGYASIDKPWLKYYNEKTYSEKIPEHTLYDALLAAANNHMEDVVFICADRNHKEVTFREFIELVESISKSLQSYGVGAGDNISATFKDTIEGIALVFAKSRLGTIEHFIDPSNSIETKMELLSGSNSKIYFLEEDLIYTSLEKMKEESGVEEIVILPNLNSTDVDGNYDGIIKFDEFIKNGKKEKLDVPYKFQKNLVSSIMYTGGSTGKSKGVMLTDYNFVAKYYKEKFSDWKWARGRKNLCVLPGIIAFGLSEGIVSPLLAGETTVLVDPLQINKFPEYILTEKPQDCTCSPIHLEFLINSPLVSDDTDLSNIEMLPCGGDGMTEMADKKIREFLKKHGANNVFAQGCGFTESTGAFCFGLGDKNLPGYMGVPLAGNVSAVFNPETGEELKYGEVGEWAVLSDTIMMGYYGEFAHLTSKALKKHSDGLVWLHPGDMVHMNENGQIAMHDRTSRTFNICGLKVYPSSLQVFISEHPAVKKCILTGIKLSSEGLVAITDQKVPIVNLSIYDEFRGNEEKIASEIDDILSIKAPSYINVFAYIFRDEMPYTGRGKIDYTRLESEGVLPSDDRKVIIKTI